MSFYGTSKNSWDRFHQWQESAYVAERAARPFVVYVKGRETEICRFSFLATAESSAQDACAQYGRDAYVLDERLGIYAEAVYRVAAQRER